MSEKKCDKCGEKQSDTRYFCSKCGAFLADDRFEYKEAYERTEVLMRRIIENLQNHPHYDILWSDTADMYMRKVERLKSLSCVQELGIDSKSAVFEKIDDFLNLCKNHEFQIAFVGTIKTGKSTLINALLGKNYASMAVTPETAALTKFRSSRRDYVKVTFYSQKEWDKLWTSRTTGADAFMREYKELEAEKHKSKWIGHKEHIKKLANSEIRNELAIWSSSKRPEHYFVKEIEVGISTLPESFPEKVVFVDTPGLSDPVAYRSEITKQYIRKANAVFVCVEAKKLQKAEIETIASVFSFSSHNKEKVHIIGTHWDKLNHPVEDWIENKQFMMKQLVGTGFFDTKKMAEKNILYSAALIHNLCRDFDEIDQSERIPLIQFAMNFYPQDEFTKFFTYPKEMVPEIMELSNIGAIQSVINDMIEHFEEMLDKDVEKLYTDVLGP